MAELFTGDVLFRGTNQSDMQRLVFREVGTPTVDHYPHVDVGALAETLKPVAWDLLPSEQVLRRGLELYPNRRRTPGEFLEMRFFNMRQPDEVGQIQDGMIYDGKRARFAFQHHTLPNDLRRFLLVAIKRKSAIPSPAPSVDISDWLVG